MAGLWGFRKNDKDKLTYKESFTHPLFLGTDIINFIKKTSINQMNALFDRLKMISSTDGITENNYKINNYKQNDIVEMYDFGHLIMDSKACEFAYIINLDNEVLEIWAEDFVGVETDSRYGTERNKNKFPPMRLVAEFPLAEVRRTSIEEIYRKLRYVPVACYYVIPSTEDTTIMDKAELVKTFFEKEGRLDLLDDTIAQQQAYLNLTVLSAVADSKPIG